MNLAEQIMGDEAAWDMCCEMAKQEIKEEERAALRRIANGISGLADAMLLAGSLGHRDLFMSRAVKIPVYACVYCGREVNDGCPDPSAFACCGEVGHVERIDEPTDYEAE